MRCNAQDWIVIWRCHQTAAQDHFGTGAVHIALVHTRMPGHQSTSLLTPCAGTWLGVAVGQSPQQTQGRISLTARTAATDVGFWAMFDDDALGNDSAAASLSGLLG